MNSDGSLMLGGGNVDNYATEVMDAPLDRPRDDGEDRTNLIINYLPQSMTDNEMYSMFITCGTLVSCKIMRDKNTGYSFGYGFVQYQNPDDAAKAITQLNGLPVSNKRIKVSYSRPNTADLRNTNLFVNNVPLSLSEHDFLNAFHPFGNIITKNILKNANGTNKGIAFIRFSKKTEAEDAIANLNGFLFPGCSVPLEVKVAEDHGKQKAAFYAGFSVNSQETGYENDYGTAAWAGSGRGRGGGGPGAPGSGRGGHSGGGNIASSMAASGYGYGFSAMQQGSAPHRGAAQSRFNPVSRGGTKGVYPPQVRGGSHGWGGAGSAGGANWGGGFRGGRGGFGDDSVAWN